MKPIDYEGLTTAILELDQKRLYRKSDWEGDNVV